MPRDVEAYRRRTLIQCGVLCVSMSPLVLVLAIFSGGAAVIWGILAGLSMAACGTYWTWKGLRIK